MFLLPRRRMRLSTWSRSASSASTSIKAALENARGNTAFISREKYDRIVYVLANWDAFTGSARAAEYKDGYEHIKHYKLVEIGGKQVLCYKDCAEVSVLPCVEVGEGGAVVSS